MKTYYLSRIFAALGITAIPTAYIAVCIACYVTIGWWLVAVIIATTIFLPVLAFQLRNVSRYREAVKDIQTEKNG